jgi:hypothetical protein
MTMQPMPTTVDYAAKIRDRIKAALVDIIPDDQWTMMIKAEVDRFLTSSTRDRSYGYAERVPSGLEEIVNQVLREEVTQRLKAMFATPEWAGQWDGTKGEFKVSERVSELIRKNAPDIIEAWLGEAVQQILRNMQNMR